MRVCTRHSLKHYSARAEKPFTHAVVDEAQDLGVAELRFMRAIVPDAPDALFFAGDLGQRYFSTTVFLGCSRR